MTVIERNLGQEVRVGPFRVQIANISAGEVQLGICVEDADTTKTLNVCLVASEQPEYVSETGRFELPSHDGPLHHPPPDGTLR